MSPKRDFHGAHSCSEDLQRRDFILCKQFGYPFMMDDIVKLNVMESSSTLFEKPIQVRVTKSPGFEDRLMELTVRIVMGISKLHRSSKVGQINSIVKFHRYIQVHSSLAY